MLRGCATGNVFISYRREDSAAYAGRICDDLTAQFGEHRVFMDVEAIQPGQNFARIIDETIAQCSAVLVVIGPHWLAMLEERDKAGQPDYVRHEIEAALKRKATIIPVLVGGASANQLTGLPETLADLPFHQAAELRDATFKDDLARVANALELVGTSQKSRVAWIGGSAAILLILAALLGWMYLGPYNAYRGRVSHIHQLLNTAATQLKLAEYESAFKTYGDVLQVDGGYGPALDGRVDAAMLWLENFSVITGEGQKAEDIAGPRLSEILAVIEAGLARTNGRGSRAADIMAHIGWAHWLNQKIAYKEFGPAAEQGLRQSLKLDPSNVYGNAMLGNWLFQTQGSFDEALRCFETAVRTNRRRPLVREMQLGAMIYHNDPEVRRELMKVANEMRRNTEPLADEQKRRILAIFSPTLHDHNELTQTLSAVSPEDTWATFLWLDDRPGSGTERETQQIQRDFIHASILEIGGKPVEALAILIRLQHELKARRYSGRIADLVAGGLKRLS